MICKYPGVPAVTSKRRRDVTVVIVAALVGVTILVGCSCRKEAPASKGSSRAPAQPQNTSAGVDGPVSAAGASSKRSAGAASDLVLAPGTAGARGSAADTPSRFSPVVANSGCTAAPVGSRVRFAVIGDYGYAGPAEDRVAKLIKSLQVDFILTTGDNNYPSGGADTIDANIGQFFREFICPYRGAYGAGSTVNRFFPTLGNHDWNSPTGSAPHREYFTLPGNERYYDFSWGDVHVFAVDSDSREPDGITSTEAQAVWLNKALSASTARWRIVAMHHPPFSSASHGSTVVMQWPYKEWGASLVLAGHDHTYERIDVNGLPYLVTGLGGVSIYSFRTEVPGSAIRYNKTFGTLLIEADAAELTVQFLNIDGERIDEFSLGAK